ncbi:class I SAM-dependent methyltransferase [Candidatus Pelagibacter ubique]|jgi:predicted O-methyltransferase YrrM|nr:class I SAM-dependent methyltransferase [Candidatus Pelagibacter ubique]
MPDNKLEQNRKSNFLFNKLYHIVFGEKFSKKINFKFDNKNRIELIKYMIENKNYKKYLEIGCHNDEVFNKISIEKIGVDPVSGGNFRGTSDEFFKKNKSNFDCIFIDGLHEYKQVKRDILNSIKFLENDGIIILHDCLPPSIDRQRVPRTRYTWNGDVWKAIVEVRTWSHVDTYTILSDQGLGIIQKKYNSDILNLKITNFDKLSYKFFYENYPILMRTIYFEEFIKITKNQ